MAPTSKWGDSAFIRDQAQIKHYVFANDYANNQVLVFDALSQSLLTKVQLSSTAKPLHMYSVYYYDQIWVHEDGTGSFDVFRTAQVRYRESAGVRASNIQVRPTSKSSSFVNIIPVNLGWSWEALGQSKLGGYRVCNKCIRWRHF